MVNKSNLKAVVLCAWVSAFAIGLVVGLSRCSTLPPSGNLIPASVSSSPGTVNNGVSPVSEPNIAVTSSPKDAASSSSIDSIVNQSACTSYAWKNRGKAPIGFIKGVAQVFAAHACEKALPLGDSDHDALAAYSMQPTLINTYTLLLGLGMRESSGNYSEGRDTSAGPETSSEAEAGPFQFSFNSIGASPDLRPLFVQYQKNTVTCLRDVFAQGISANTQSVLGTGEGAVFQQFTRTCPAFAVEYAATLIRVLKRHFGPLIRKEAEFIPACQQMFADVQKAVCK